MGQQPPVEPHGRVSFAQYYDDYPRIEEELQAALSVSLDPRGPDHLYDVVAALALPSDSRVIDLGCGEGDDSLELARRFGFDVRGIDPVDRHLEIANAKLLAGDEDLSRRVRFVRGTAEQIPVTSSSVDLVFCREVLYHVEALQDAFVECRRVLQDDGAMVIYQLFSTERLEPREAEWFWKTCQTFASSADRHHMDVAIEASGLRIVENIELASETGEWAEEQHGKASRELLAAARLLRQPQRYLEEFGRTAYEIKLADSFWHVYRMIGKLSNRIYVLQPAR